MLDLLEQLRQKDVFDLSQVAYAMLETNGKLSVLLKPEFHPVVRNDMNLAGPPESLAQELIFNGVVVEPNLRQAGVSREWLSQQLRSQGIKNESEVFLAIIGANKQLYVDLYQDKLTAFIDVDDEPQRRVKK